MNTDDNDDNDDIKTEPVPEPAPETKPAPMDFWGWLESTGSSVEQWSRIYGP